VPMDIRREEFIQKVGRHLKKKKRDMKGHQNSHFNKSQSDKTYIGSSIKDHQALSDIQN